MPSGASCWCLRGLLVLFVLLAHSGASRWCLWCCRSNATRHANARMIPEKQPTQQTYVFAYHMQFLPAIVCAPATHCAAPSTARTPLADAHHTHAVSMGSWSCNRMFTNRCACVGVRRLASIRCGAKKNKQPCAPGRSCGRFFYSVSPPFKCNTRNDEHKRL